MKHKKQKIPQQLAQSNPKSPVTVKAVLISQVKHPIKRRFLEQFYATDGNVSACTQSLGIHRHTYYDWVKNDEIFRYLIEEQKRKLLDDLDHQLVQRAKSEKGTTELIFWLKTHHQDYKQNDTFAYRDNDKEFILTRGR
jgi:DNA-binding protein Fis